MKTAILSALIILAITNGCVNDNDYASPKLACTQPNLTPNKTVPEIMAQAGAVVTQYPYDDIIEAYVVSSDEGGNFFKTISLQTLATETTPAVGFSMPIDATNAYVGYRVGAKVYIKMKDLYTDINYGSLRIGGITVTTYGHASVGRMTPSVFTNQLVASCTYLNENDLVKKVTVPQLLSDANLNTLVEVSGVQFAKVAVGKHYYETANDTGGATNWTMSDASGKTFIFRTSSYADFAENIVPPDSGIVRGVLTKYGTDYQFMARSEADIQLGIGK